MVDYKYIKSEELPTVKETKEKYKGYRNLQIITHPDHSDKVIEVSVERPCIRCGKYHKRGSKPEMKCTALIMGMVYDVVNIGDSE